MSPLEMMETDIDKFLMMCKYLCNLGERNKLPQTDEKEEAADFWAAI